MLQLLKHNVVQNEMQESILLCNKMYIKYSHYTIAVNNFSKLQKLDRLELTQKTVQPLQ